MTRDNLDVMGRVYVHGDAFWPTWGDGLTLRNALDRCAICSRRRILHPWLTRPRGWPFREPIRSSELVSS